MRQPMRVPALETGSHIEEAKENSLATRPLSPAGPWGFVPDPIAEKKKEKSQAIER
jgi:hypothetical protein